MSEMKATAVTILNCILSYPHLKEMWAPKDKPNQTKKYCADAIFTDETDFEACNVAIEAAIREEWPNEVPEEIARPWKKVKDGPYKGLWSLSAKDDKNAPDVVNLNRDPIMDDKEIFAGCKVHMNVNFYGTSNGGSPRVAVGLGPIMIADNSADMPRLAQGSMSVKDAFKGIEGAPAATAAVGGVGGPAATGAPESQGPTGPG